MSKIKISRRVYATALFVFALVFFAVEVFLVFTAKNSYDYDRAKDDAEELSVELGLISSALRSGDETLYKNSVSRYRATLMSFSDNEYVHNRQADLLSELRGYSDTLSERESEVLELLALSVAISSVRSELQDIDTKKLDTANIYQAQRSFQALKDSLDDIKSENLADIKAKLGDFSQKIIDLTKNASICVAVCPKESFVSQQNQLKKIREQYEKEFKELGEKASQIFDPSKLVTSLGSI